MRNGICWENQKSRNAWQAGGWYQCLLLFAGASLGMCSAYMQLMDTYPLLKSLTIPGAYVWYVLLAIAAFAVVYGSGKLKYRWMCLLPALPCGWCFYHYYREHRLPVEDGGLYVARCYVKELCRFFKTSILFPNGLREEAPRALLFWCLLFVCVLFVAAAFFRFYPLLLLPPAALLAAHIAVGRSPGWNSLLVLLAAGLILFSHWAAMPDRWYVRTAQLAGVCGVCVVISLLCASVPGRVVGMHEDVQKKQLSLEDAVLALPVWGMFGQQHGVVDNHSPDTTGREVLTFRLSDEPAENIYLKNFAASHYENGRWTNSPAFAAAAAAEGLDAAAAGERLLAECHEEGQYIFENGGEIDFLAYGGWSVAKPKQYDYRIACKDFGTQAPLPYLSALPQELSMDGDTAAKRPWNLRRYSGSLMAGGNKNDPVEEYLQMYYAVQGWSWFAGHYAGSPDSYDTGTGGRQPHAGSGWYSGLVQEDYAPASDNPIFEEFMSRYIYDDSGWFDGLRSYMDALREDGETAVLNGIRLGEAQSVQHCMKNFGTYSQKLDPLPQGMDPVDYFLGTSERGYCVHYASAATLILQSMGVPARYASGYVVFPGDLKREKGTDGYTAHVTDARAHAWVEIYLEEIGWIPVEMTPGFDYDSTKEDTPGTKPADDRKDDAEKAPEMPDEPQEEHETKEDVKKPQTDMAGQKSGTSGMSRERKRLAGLAAAAAVAVVSVCIIVRMLRERERRLEEQIEKALAQGRYNEAAGQMNRRIYCFLRRRAAGVGIKDDEAYRDALAGLDADSDADAYIRLVKQARFSNEEMCTRDAQTLYGLYCIYREKLRHRMTHTKKEVSRHDSK